MGDFGSDSFRYSISRSLGKLADHSPDDFPVGVVIAALPRVFTSEIANRVLGTVVRNAYARTETIVDRNCGIFAILPIFLLSDTIFMFASDDVRYRTITRVGTHSDCGDLSSGDFIDVFGFGFFDLKKRTGEVNY